MIHMQSGTPGWLGALLEEPDYALVKSVDDPSVLREAKQVWAQNGRDPSKLHTLYRHHNVSTADGDWQSALAHWRVMFRRWVDRTYLEQYAPYVDMVSEANEYTATSTWQSATDTARVMQNMRAAVQIWNGEFRGRVVTSNDGGQGLIPSDCRLAILAGPVSNDVPKAVFQLAKDSDSVLDYHAYTHCFAGNRSDFDWRDHSGRIFRHEQEHGVKCLHVAGEAGPYLGVFEGWRHPLVLSGDMTRYLAVERAVYRDIARTPAYLEGRFLGRARFTVGGGSTWSFYNHDGGNLLALARMDAQEWKPGEIDVDKLSPENQAKVKVHLDAIWAIVTGTAEWWVGKPTPFKLKATGNVIPFFNANGTPRTTPPLSRAITGNWDVWQVNGDLGRVTDFNDPARPDWWVKLQTVEQM